MTESRKSEANQTSDTTSDTTGDMARNMSPNLAPADENTEAHTAPEARRYGFPAVCGHEVCALRTVARQDSDSSSTPARIELLRWRKGSGALVRPLPLNRLYVWARAGRISFGAADGRTVDVVLLGEPETEGVRLGAPWPLNHHRTSMATNVAHGVVSDLKNVVTFPVSFPRMMRISGERNTVLDSIVAWCQREVPDIHIMRGWWRGSEGPTPHQVSGSLHKGLIGEPGWLPDTVGAHPTGWSPFHNDRNAFGETSRSNAHEHPSGA